MTEEASPEPRFRRHKGLLGSIEKALLICIPLAGVVGILDVFLYFGISVYIQQYLAVLLGLVLALVPLLVPAAKSSPRERLPWYDAAISLGGLVIGLYMVIFYPSIAVSMGILTPDRIILGALAIVLVLESCRRLLGWPLVIIVAFFIFYAHFTNIFPGALYGRGVPLPRLATYLYVDENALFSIAMRVTGTIVLAFIFFGRAIFATGGGQFLTNLAMSIMGGFRGGPAKVSVIASSSFGMMSGSAVANVATTGVVTIPLMKKSGYPAYYAGAVEATASSGGQIMPPVMGAAAFLMAQFLGMPYAKVVVAAIVPAILYYVGVFVQVDLEAVKSNLKGLPRNLLPSVKKTLLDGWIFFIPLIVLVYSLFVLFLDPDSAGLYSVASVLVVTAVRKASRINLRKLLAILEDTGEGLLEITVIAAADSDVRRKSFHIAVVGSSRCHCLGHGDDSDRCLYFGGHTYCPSPHRVGDNPYCCSYVCFLLRHIVLPYPTHMSGSLHRCLNSWLKAHANRLAVNALRRGSLYRSLYLRL
jgi:TRAP transporter 4TM/12TM fusion protein